MIKKNNKRLQVTIPAETMELMETVAAKTGIDKTQQIKILISKYYRKEFEVDES